MKFGTEDHIYSWEVIGYISFRYPYFRVRGPNTWPVLTKRCVSVKNSCNKKLQATPAGMNIIFTGPGSATWCRRTARWLLCYNFSHLSENELQQGRLSGSVGPDEGQPRVEVQTELQVPVDPRRRLAVPEAHVLKTRNKLR